MLFGSPRSASHEVDSPDKPEWVTERPVSDSPEAPKYGPTVSTLIPIFSRLPCGDCSLLRPSRRACLQELTDRQAHEHSIEHRRRDQRRATPQRRAQGLREERRVDVEEVD